MGLTKELQDDGYLLKYSREHGGVYTAMYASGRAFVAAPPENPSEQRGSPTREAKQL